MRAPQAQYKCTFPSFLWQEQDTPFYPFSPDPSPDDRCVGKRSPGDAVTTDGDMGVLNGEAAIAHRAGATSGEGSSILENT